MILDANGDGVLSREEVQNIVEKTELYIPIDADKIMEICDTNNDN